MTKVSVLGCGWLGLPLGKQLVDLGFEVKGSTTHPDKLKLLTEAGIKPFIIRLDPELSTSAKDFFSSEIMVINIPPRNPPNEPHYHYRQLISVHSMVQLFQVKKVIFISSTSVYPSNNQQVVEANADPNQLTRSGVSLVEMENLFMEDSHFDTTVIRFGGLYGPERHPGNFLAGKKDLSGATNPINMIHLDDCIGIIYQVIQQEAWGEVFNAVSPNMTTRKAFYLNAAAELDLEPPTFNNQPADYKEVVSRKLINQLNYRFIH